MYRRPARLVAALATCLLASSVALAQPSKPKSDEEIAEDAATQPVEDLGIDKKDIPELLLQIEEAPYSLSGIRTCRDIRARVQELDEVLGDDLDTAEEKSRGQKRKEAAGRVGGGLLGGLIPFRGLVREVTGAAARDRAYNRAVYAGVARRSFLKGVGQQKGCKHPAAPISVR